MNWTRGHKCALCILFVVASTSCRVSNEPAANTKTSPETVVSATPPFQTSEPDRYQATRTITIVTAKGETIVTKTLIARDGPMRREESEGVVYLDLPAGRFVLMPDRQVYAAATAEDQPAPEDEENSPDRLLHTDPISTTYQGLGTEAVAGRNTNKYRVVVNNSAAENVSQNETLMWVDETLRMPVKSETKSAGGAHTTMELSDISLDPDKQLFQIPANYEKIAFRDIWKQLRSGGLNP
jgi:outer membrane lipoprotein-sorting protein